MIKHDARFLAETESRCWRTLYSSSACAISTRSTSIAPKRSRHGFQVFVKAQRSYRAAYMSRIRGRRNPVACQVCATGATKRNAVSWITRASGLQHLDRIRDNRALLGTRWIWNSYRSARDVATETGVVVSIEVRTSHLAVSVTTAKPSMCMTYPSNLSRFDQSRFEWGGCRYGSGFIAPTSLPRRASARPSF